MAEANLQREVALLFANHAEPHYHNRIHKELNAAEQLTSTMAMARDLVIQMKASKKESDKFDYEEFKEKAEAFNAWLQEAKEAYPGYFSHVESPFGDNLKEVDSKRFISNVEEIIEKTHELIAHMQGKLPITTLEIDRTIKVFSQIVEMMSEGLRQQGRSNSSITHNLRSQ